MLTRPRPGYAKPCEGLNRDGRGLNLLLVTRDAAWTVAVKGAAQSLDDSSVNACVARDAVNALASISSHYSHVLVDEEGADGLFNEIADLATEIAQPDTDMLALGILGRARRRVRIIRSATTQSVREALMATLPPRGRSAIEMSELRAALDGAMIETRYQPIIRVADRRPVGLEALARLNHPQEGTILPDRFVPQIEDAGLAAALTSLVSARALADLNGPFLAERGLLMSVNFPLDVLLQPDALTHLEEQRIASDIPADRIIVELTESRPVEDLKGLSSVLERLRALGYGAAIDDVGPGVPHIHALLDLPFTCMKIDKDLVQQACDDGDGHAFLRDVISRAKAKGLFIVAEGVESAEIWNIMADLGVHAVQGFLAARPLPVAAVPIWWDSWLQNQPAC